MDKYEVLEQIGAGTFGEVHKYRNKATGEILAVKRLKQRFKDWQQCLELPQVKALRKLVHPNVIKLKQLIRVKQQAFLIFQFHRLTLYTYISERKGLPEEQVVHLGRQIAEGMAFIHKSGIFHRDLKPQNFLVADDMSIKIIDFGIAKEIRSKPPFTDYISTRWYRAPEMLLKAVRYSAAIDVYAYGCILAEMLLGKPLFCGASQADQLSKILSVLGTPQQSEWPQGYRLASQKGLTLPLFTGYKLKQILETASQNLFNLIETCVQLDHSKRPSFNAILMHPLFSAPIKPMKIKDPDIYVTQAQKKAKQANKSYSLSRSQSTSSTKSPSQQPPLRNRGQRLSMVTRDPTLNVSGSKGGQLTARKALGLFAMQSIKRRY